MTYAGFWRRSVAYAIDWGVLNVLTLLIQLPLMWGFAVWGFGLAPDTDFHTIVKAFNGVHLLVLNSGIYLCLSFPYCVWGHFRYATTLGKKLVGVRVIRADGGPITLNQSILRWAAYAVSYLPVGAGFVMAAFHPYKRCLHDLIAGTVSVTGAPAPEAAPKSPS